jgi:hypothetical protein
MPFGYLDTRYIDFPANVDLRYIEGLRTRAGWDFRRLLREIDSRLGALNTTVDPLVAALITPTDREFAEGFEPTAFEVNEAGEYTIARPQLAEGQAHMLPLRKFDTTLGTTEDGLEEMRIENILLNVDSLFLGYRLAYRRLALRRLFSDAEERVDPKTVVTSPGFAGSGTGDNVFRGSYPDGAPLEGGFSLYYRIAAAALEAGLKAVLMRLRRFHQGPFDLIAPQAQIDAIAAMPSFVDAGSALIRQGSGVAEALVDANLYVGVFDKDVRVRKAILDTADPNIAIFKSYGNLNPRNPLAWRYDPQSGRGAYVRYRSNYPLDNAVVKQKLGIGVNNRTAAALIRVGDAGGYVAPAV